MKTIKRMNIKEFRELGFLQEANRLFFHPLGLALEVIIEDDSGETRLGGIWDYRDDPEGIFFEIDNSMKDKAKKVDDLRKSKIKARKKHNCDENGIQKID